MIDGSILVLQAGRLILHRPVMAEKPAHQPTGPPGDGIGEGTPPPSDSPPPQLPPPPGRQRSPQPRREPPPPPEEMESALIVPKVVPVVPVYNGNAIVTTQTF